MKFYPLSAAGEERVVGRSNGRVSCSEAILPPMHIGELTHPTALRWSTSLRLRRKEVKRANTRVPCAQVKV